MTWRVTKPFTIYAPDEKRFAEGAEVSDKMAADLDLEAKGLAAKVKPEKADKGSK